MSKSDHIRPNFATIQTSLIHFAAELRTTIRPASVSPSRVPHGHVASPTLPAAQTIAPPPTASRRLPSSATGSCRLPHVSPTSTSTLRPKTATAILPPQKPQPLSVGGASRTTAAATTHGAELPHRPSHHSP